MPEATDPAVAVIFTRITSFFTSAERITVETFPFCINVDIIEELVDCPAALVANVPKLTSN